MSAWQWQIDGILRPSDSQVIRRDSVDQSKTLSCVQKGTGSTERVVLKQKDVM